MPVAGIALVSITGRIHPPAQRIGVGRFIERAGIDQIDAAEVPAGVTQMDLIEAPIPGRDLEALAIETHCAVATSAFITQCARINPSSTERRMRCISVNSTPRS
jgi:hypothetical protein